MGKKAGAVKEKRNAKVRLEKVNTEATPESANHELKAAQQGKVRSLFRKKSEPQGSPGAIEKVPSKSKDDKKTPVKGKDIRTTREANRPKRSFFKDAAKFFQSTWVELKKVHWPNRSEIAVYTAVVIGSVVVVALLIWLVDSALSWLLELII